MNRTYRALGLAACFVLCFSFLVGCGGGNGVTLTGVAVTPASASIAAGATQQFTATGMYSDNSTKDLTSSATWASATTSVATISGSGLATAVATGSTNITATAAGKTSAPATLTVTAPTVVSIAVTPATASIVVGNTQQFTATATYSDKSTKDITSTATWSSGTTGVATISAAEIGDGRWGGHECDNGGFWWGDVFSGGYIDGYGDWRCRMSLVIQDVGQQRQRRLAFQLARRCHSRHWKCITTEPRIPCPLRRLSRGVSGTTGYGHNWRCEWYRHRGCDGLFGNYGDRDGCGGQFNGQRDFDGCSGCGAIRIQRGLQQHA